jgi:hypothetical protein
MLKNKKLQKGKGKRIKLQWQYRTINLIQFLINLPQNLKRKMKWLQLTFKRFRSQRETNRKRNIQLNEEAIARANAITKDMFFNKHFNL